MSQKPPLALRALTLLLAVFMLTAGVLKAQGCQSAPPAPEAQEPAAPDDAPDAAPAALNPPAPEAEDMTPDQAEEPEFFPATKSGKPMNPNRKFMPATKSAMPMPEDEEEAQDEGPTLRKAPKK
jgi:hypothetical protein